MKHAIFPVIAGGIFHSRSGQTDIDTGGTAGGFCRFEGIFFAVNFIEVFGKQLCRSLASIQLFILNQGVVSHIVPLHLPYLTLVLQTGFQWKWKLPWLALEPMAKYGVSLGRPST